MAKFEQPGDACSGTVESAERHRAYVFGTREPKLNADGSPAWVYVLVIDTGMPDETGETLRRVYLRGGMIPKLRQAVAASGSPRVAHGATITVAFEGFAQRTTFGGQVRRWSVQYAPPPANVS
ncbi:MAG: hypothetical protein ACKV2O_24290 [Acidimicrobiales bacterium]